MELQEIINGENSVSLSFDEKDEKVYNTIMSLLEKCGDWLDYVDDIGNQCASTDRGVEAIIELSKQLEEFYNMEV